MWRVISFLLLFLGLAGFSSVSFADTIPSTSNIVIETVGKGSPDWIGGGTAGPIAACKRFFPNDNCFFHVDGNVWQIAIYGGTFKSVPSCPSGYDLSSDKKTCTKPDGPQPCTAAQFSAYCATHASQRMPDATSWAGNSPTACNNEPSDFPSFPANCKVPPEWGCRQVKNFATNTWTLNGQTCSASRSPDGTADRGPIPAKSQQDCGTGEYFGEVNGVPGCYGGGPVPPSSAPPVTQGKDSSGNCGAGYVGRVNDSGTLECIPSTQPDQNANCPTGWNKIGVGGQTVCVDPNSKPGDPIPSNPGSGGGGGGKTDTSSPSKDPGKGDSSSPGIDDPSKCTLPDWVCNLGNGVSGPDGGSPSGLGSMGGDISALLDTSDFFGGGSCPAPKVVSVPLYLTTWEWTISYDPFCNIVSRLRPAVIACGFLVAVAIVVKR